MFISLNRLRRMSWLVAGPLFLLLFKMNEEKTLLKTCETYERKAPVNTNESNYDY